LALSVIAWIGGLWANHVAWFMLLLGCVAALANQLPKKAAQPFRVPPSRLQLRAVR
jgi:hypothetical protein